MLLRSGKAAAVLGELACRCLSVYLVRSLRASVRGRALAANDRPVGADPGAVSAKRDLTRQSCGVPSRVASAAVAFEAIRRTAVWVLKKSFHLRRFPASSFSVISRPETVMSAAVGKASRARYVLSPLHRKSFRDSVNNNAWKGRA